MVVPYDKASIIDMKIIYTDHALERLKERGIAKDEVDEALRQGAKIGAKGDNMQASLRNKTGNLIVIYNIDIIKKKIKVIVISAYYQ